MKKLIISLVILFGSVSLNAKDYLASSFGIKSNGTTMNTSAIQYAIDYISANGGGRLCFKVGRYLTGTIELKDNVTIDLGEGAILVGSPCPYDYKHVVGGFIGFVTAKGAKNIGITGLGVIDGQGRTVANNYLAQIAVGYIQDGKVVDGGSYIKDPLGLGRPADRPHALYFRECENVVVKGINIRNSACWTSTYDQCKNVLIEKVTIDSRAFWNNDGMDIVDCENLTVRNCFVNASDDGICLKSHDATKCCDNILVENNVITSSASGIKFGTFGKGGFRNVKLIGNTVYDTFRSALAIEAVDGGMAENIEVDGLKSLNTANPIFLIVGERHGVGSYMKNVRIANVYAEVPSEKPDRGYDYEGPTLEDEPRNPSPCSIVGLPGNNISGVTLENVEIKFTGGGNADYACIKTNELDKVPEMPKAYPEFSQFKELPAWGFYIRHADNVVFNNVVISATAKDYRPAVVLDDVQDSNLKGLKATAPSMKTKVFAAKNCKNIKK